MPYRDNHELQNEINKLNEKVQAGQEEIKILEKDRNINGGLSITLFVTTMFLCLLLLLTGRPEDQLHRSWEDIPTEERANVKQAIHSKAKKLGYEDFFSRCYSRKVMTMKDKYYWHCYLEVDRATYSFKCTEDICVYDETITTGKIDSDAEVVAEKNIVERLKKLETQAVGFAIIVDGKRFRINQEDDRKLLREAFKLLGHDVEYEEVY